MTRLADRPFEMVLRNRVLFGVGAIERLPEVVASAGGSRVVRRDGPRRSTSSGVIDPILERLAAAGIETARLRRRRTEPRRLDRRARSARPCVTSGSTDSVVVASVAARRWTPPRRSTSGRPTTGPLGARVRRPDLAAGRPIVAVPTTAGTGAEAHSFAVITNEEPGRKDYIGHPSLLPVDDDPGPGLTVGLPPAATAATGVDAMTHSLESLLSANPNPFAEAMALGVIRTVGTWLRTAVADGSDLEARSQMLMASHLAGVGQASGTGVGLVHALGHSIGSRGKVAHGTALAAVLPEVLRFYLGTAIASSPLSASLSASRRARIGVDGSGRRHRRHRKAPPRRRPASDDSATSASPTTPPSTSSSPTPSTTPRSATRRAFRHTRKRGRSWSPSPADDRADDRPKTRGPYHPGPRLGAMPPVRVSKGSDGRRRLAAPARAGHVRSRPRTAKLDRTRRSRASLTRWGRHRPSAHRRCGPPTATQGHDERRGGRAGDAGGPRRLRRAHQCFGESHLRARQPDPPRHRPSAGRDPGGDRQSVAGAASAARPGTVRGVAAPDGRQRLL